MKTKLYSILAGALMIGVATSCDEQWTPAIAEEGTVNLSSLSVNMSDAEKVTSSVLSRATVDLNGFIVTITDKSGENSPRTYTYGQMPEVLTLPVGTYSIDVESHKVQSAEWEKPYYKGSKDFTIVDGKITDIGVITCAFSSLKVTVEFDPALMLALGDDVKVTVIANNEGKLEFSKSETRAGYYKVIEGSTTMVAHFEGTVDGSRIESDVTFADVVPGQYRKIIYSAKYRPTPPGQSGSVGTSGITLDTTITTENIDSNITVDEDIMDSTDRPGKEDPKPGEGGDTPGEGDGSENPGGGNEPEEKAITFEASATSTNLSLSGENVASEDFGDAIVVIKSTAGIKNLVVTITSDSDQFGSVLNDMDFAEPFDLAYPRDGKNLENLTNLQLPVKDAVIGKKEVEFNITIFVPLLNIYKPAKYTFVLSATDNNNVCETLTLRFQSL